MINSTVYLACEIYGKDEKKLDLWDEEIIGFYEAGEERVFIGYEDIFSIETNFQLKYKPIEHTINMYVNGVKYEKDIF